MFLTRKLVELKRRPLLAKVLANAGWLVGDKVLRLGVGLLVMVWVARYLGPEQYGKWNYGIAFATLFGSFATLGLDSIVVRDLVHNPDKASAILGTTFALKMVAALVAILIIAVCISIFRPGDTELIVITVLSAGAFFFQASNIIDFYFQAGIRSKYSVLAQNAAFLLMAAVKYVLLQLKAPLIQFVWATLAEAALTAVFMFIAFNAQKNTVKQWRFDRSYALKVLKDGFPLIWSGLAVSIYYKIGLVMLGQMRGDKETGIYSAATKISELWYFVPVALAASVFPSLVEKFKHSRQEYLMASQKFYDAMFLLALVVALGITAVGPKAASILYGAQYEGVAPILLLHIWAGLFVCLGLASSNNLTSQGLQKYGLYRTAIGCLSNVALNFVLIPLYGGLGAAAATVVSYGISTFSIGFFRPGREIFHMLMNSINIFRLLRLPFRKL